MNWINNEEGPKCSCGFPTSVYIDNENQPWLMCLFHTSEEGIMWPLPIEKPNDWNVNINRERLGFIMEEASKKYFSKKEV